MSTSETQKQKQPSPELLSLIKAAAQSLLGFGELWNSIKKKGHDEGFTERELQDILRPLLKPQLNKDQIYYLFHTEEKKIQNKEHYDNRINPTNLPKKELEQSDHDWHYEQGEKEEEQMEKIQEYKKAEAIREEDPKDIEIAFLKEELAQLKDAFKKTEQFKPATALEGKRLSLDETAVFDWLGKRDDKIKCFYFGYCGTGFIKANILKNLENSGIKTFKRLYFEV